jgi:hypothetical protein
MRISVLFCFLLCSSLWAQIRVATITDETTASSKAVAIALRSKIALHPNQFTLVDPKDSKLSLLVTSDCIPQKQKGDPFVCFYTSAYAGGTTKTFMGGGIYQADTAENVADNFLSSLAQDVVERWDGMVRANAIENLETCLMLTQSSCKVPDPLVPDLKMKTINLSQYMQHVVSTNRDQPRTLCKVRKKNRATPSAIRSETKGRTCVGATIRVR